MRRGMMMAGKQTVLPPQPGTALSARMTSTSYSAPLPASAAGEDYIVIVIGSGAAAQAVPSGYTQLSYQAATSSWPQLGVYGKVSGGETTASISTGNSGNAGAYYAAVLKGVTISPIVSLSEATSNTPTPANNEGARRRVITAAAWTYGSGTNIVSFPSEMTELRASTNPSSITLSGAIAASSQNIDAGENGGSYQISASITWRCATLMWG